MQRRPIFLILLILVTLTPVLSACGSADAKELTLAPESALPDFVGSAPPQVKEAYRFAIANPEVLEALPCYCGCGNVGHENNLDCYIKEVAADGTIAFENHAFG
jgi:hypothetical protein